MAVENRQSRGRAIKVLADNRQGSGPAIKAQAEDQSLGGGEGPLRTSHYSFIPILKCPFVKKQQFLTIVDNK